MNRLGNTDALLDLLAMLAMLEQWAMAATGEMADPSLITEALCSI